MIPGVYYNPGYGGGACIPVGSVDGGYKCCETTSGGFADPSDPSCARDVGIAAPTNVTHGHDHLGGRSHPHVGGSNSTVRHFDRLITSGHPLGTPHKKKRPSPGGASPTPVSSVKPEPGHNYYIQQAPLCTMRYPPGDHYTLIMCTATCQEQFTYSGPSPDGNLALGSIGGSALCHGKTAVPWSCIMSTPDC